MGFRTISQPGPLTVKKCVSRDGLLAAKPLGDRQLRFTAAVFIGLINLAARVRALAMAIGSNICDGCLMQMACQSVGMRPEDGCVDDEIVWKPAVRRDFLKRETPVQREGARGAIGCNCYKLIPELAACCKKKGSGPSFCPRFAKKGSCLAENWTRPRLFQRAASWARTRLVVIAWKTGWICANSRSSAWQSSTYDARRV